MNPANMLQSVNSELSWGHFLEEYSQLSLLGGGVSSDGVYLHVQSEYIDN